jgi:hypothetical protein
VIPMILGRSKEEVEKYGNKATVFLGRLIDDISKDVFFDVNRSHVVIISGKRGYGKSYTLGILAEGLMQLPHELRKRVAVIIIDTMGIYWPMKRANVDEEELLEKWGLQPLPFDVEVLYPIGFEDYYSERDLRIFFDEGFVIKPSGLSPTNWCYLLNIDENQASATVISRVVRGLKKEKGE